MVAKLKQSGDGYVVSLPPEAVGQLAPGGVKGEAEVEVAVHEGSVVLRPVSDRPSERVRQTAGKVMDDYDSALKRLAE